MTRLMVEVEGGEPSGPKVGGVPWAPVGTSWPVCRSCKGAMQFLAQAPVAAAAVPALEGRDEWLLLFQCQNKPGMCDDWDADGGGNAALLVAGAGRIPMEPPAGETRLPGESRVVFEPLEATTAKEALQKYCARADADPRVVGMIGGRPTWIQGDETPSCACGQRMLFVVQLEAWGAGGINFGDAGAGFGFVCGTCRDSAKFLWQCG